MQKRFFLLIAVILVGVTSMMAQVTTSSISGRVAMQNNNEEVIGATVQAEHIPSGTRYAAVTNTEGRFNIQGMRAGGPYTVTVSYIGTQTKSFDNITLALGETYELEALLVEDATLLNEVTVTGLSGLAATRTGAAETIYGERLRELPSITHGMADVARVNPFVKVNEQGVMNIAGSNNKYNAIQIDGAMASDAFGLTYNGSNGGQAGTQAFSMETIDQLQVSIAPFDVRQGGFAGGLINAITKSGTNDFHGSLYGYYSNGDMVGKKYVKYDGTDSPEYGDMTDYTFGATLGGPIVKDKLFFFANFERTNKEFDNAYSTNNNMSKVDFDVAQNILDEVKRLAAQQGVNYTGTLGTPKQYTRSDKAGLKLDWNINERNHASLRWSLVDARQNNQTATAAMLVTNDYAYDFVSKANSLVFELQSQIKNNMNNEFHVSWTSVRDKRNPGLPFPMIQVTNVGGGTLNIGNERSSMANNVGQDVYTITDNFSWTIGKHVLTIGTHDELYHFSNLFCQDLYGSYYFATPADFFNLNMRQFRYGQGVESVTGTRRWTPEFSAAQLGFYAQEKWNVTRRFNFTLGLRVDIPFMLDTPTENAEFNNWAQAHNYDLKTNVKMSAKPMLSPRAGFRYDVLGNKNLIVRGGVGVFTGNVPYVWLSNSFSNTGVQQLSYNNTKNLKDIQFILDPNQVYRNLPTNSSGAPTFAAQTVNVFNKDFKFSQQLRADLAFDINGPLGIKWTLEGIYSKTLNDIIVKKLNIEETGQTYGQARGLSFDSRPMFSTMSGTANIYMLDNVSEGYSYNVSLKAEKSFDFGLDLMASYTYGISKNVSNGSATVAASNWQYNYTHSHPNKPELANSNFNIPHQLFVSAYQHINWNSKPGRVFDNQTTIGLVYAGNSGSPYSLFYNGDLNGDGGFNDLMFIPTDKQIDEMLAAGLFLGTDAYPAETQAANMKSWLAKEDYLKDHRGEYFDRNAANEKWENRLDLHIDHKFGFKVGKDIRYLQLGLDILNFTNMLNKKWGATLSQNGYTYYYPVTINGGKFQFLRGADFDMHSTTDYDAYYSRWRMQVSARLIF